MALDLFAPLDFAGFYKLVASMYKAAVKDANKEALTRLKSLTSIAIIKCPSCSKEIMVIRGNLMQDAKCRCGTVVAWSKYGREDSMEDFLLYEPELHDDVGNVLLYKEGGLGGGEDEDDFQLPSPRRRRPFGGMRRVIEDEDVELEEEEPEDEEE